MASTASWQLVRLVRPALLYSSEQLPMTGCSTPSKLLEPVTGKLLPSNGGRMVSVCFATNMELCMAYSTNWEIYTAPHYDTAQHPVTTCVRV
jgi:hypothetical protein